MLPWQIGGMANGAYLHLRAFPAPVRPLRVAVVTETYPPEINGVALTIRHMVNALCRQGHRVQLIRPRQRQEDALAAEPNLEQLLLRGVAIPRYQNLQMGLPAGSALKHEWNANRPDVVHIVTEGPLGWSALAVASKLKIPVTSDFHTNFHSYTRHYGAGWLSRPIGAYLRHFHNRTRLTLVPDEHLRYELESQGYKNLAVVGRGVDIGLFNPERRDVELRRSWGVGEQDLVAVYVGRLAPEKNLGVVIDAYNALRARQPSAKLVWVGDGPERKILQNRNPAHIFAGMRTGDDLAAHYASADVFLFPSLTETFGNVTLEAMASGLAVVAYNYAAAQNYIRHGESGLLAEFDDVAQFLAQIVRLAVRPQMIAVLGDNARRSVESLSWEHICEHFEQLLLGIVDEGGRYGKQDRFMSGANASVRSGAMPPL
ncbi:MAG TPA: glycosyltransferase family 1 protein [Sulfuricella sp.]|nr:glycosyltransferase family 1 protein [Sulfuricella sp.]